jgi:EAL domain-containing protein (putative c-di-GMP-specific phosphodiesterase class I)/DNA-binding NarL/FixJ family response regulator
MERIRVLIADDEPSIRQSLTTVVESDPSMEVVGTAPDAQGAIDLAELRQPDVALLDVRMPGGGGPHATREIVRRSPPTRVVALSAFEDRESVLTMIRAGARSYVGKDASNDQILAAIHDTLGGDSALTPGAMTEVFQAFAESVNDGRPDPDERLRRDRIRRIVRRRAVDFVFQPVVQLETLRTAGVEAFARFRTHPKRPPDRWFAEAEAAGLGRELELISVGVALAQLDDVPAGCYLGINASPETAATPEFLELVEASAAERVVVELSERASLEGEELNAALAELRERGVRLALDDAWARYSSLSHIVRLAPDVIKLDMSITRDIAADPTRQALVTALLSFATDIGTDVVAKGVETARELQVLRDLGVGFAQGYYLARPGPIPVPGAWGLATLGPSDPAPAA